MSDVHETGSEPDVVEAAARYREQLQAELEKVEAFLETAGEFAGTDDHEVPDLWAHAYPVVSNMLH